MTTTKLLTTITVAALSTACYGQGSLTESQRAWVTPGAISYHTDRAARYNERNTGFGVEYEASDKLAYMVGQYHNSIRNTTQYAMVQYTPVMLSERVRLGVMAGAVNGYSIRDGGWFPMALPVATVEYRHFGVNLSAAPVIPGGGLVVAAQFKFRF